MLCALLTSAGMWAVSWTPSEVGAGTFYFYNVGADKYLCSGNNWGSRASLNEHPVMEVTLAVYETGFSISTNSIYEGRYLGSNGYLDNADVSAWTFEAVAGQTNTYKLKNGDNYLSWSGGTSTCASLGSDPGDAKAYWKLVTKENLVNDLKNNATDAAPLDATFYLKNSWFAKGNGITIGRNVLPKGWSGTNVTDYWGKNADDETTNYCVEQLSKTFDNYQSLTTVRNGKYKLKAKGFYRGSVVPYIYLTASSTEKCNLKPKAGSENSISDGATSIKNGTYNLDGTAGVIVTDGSLVVGVKSDENVDWTVFDDFSLSYYGNAVEVYSPAAFTSPSSAEAGTWYAFTVTNAGMYKITSSKAATIYYTQDESDDADDDVSNKTIAADNGFFYQGLSVGTFYFKTSDAGTITIEKSYDDGDDVTSLYITNPSFEDENPITSWACKYYTPAGPNREKSHAASDKTYYAAFWNSNPNVTNGIELYQSVKLPAGYWRLEFDAYNNGDNPNKWSKVQLYFGDDIKSSELDYKSPTNKWQTYSYEFEINTETTANLGVKFIPTTTTQIWENADNFRLTYLYSITPSTEKQSLLDEITKANGIYDSKSANIGTGVFQIPTAAGTTFTAAIATARGVYNNASATAGEVTAATTALATAEETFLSSVNAPDPEKRYGIIVATTGHAKEGEAMGIALGAITVNNPTGYSISTVNTTNQSVAFTQVSGNLYNISYETAAGTTYLTYGTTNGSAAGWSDSQIQATTEVEKKGQFKIVATSTANKFNIYNTITNSTIACQDAGNMYTQAGNADFSLTEAVSANMAVNGTAKWGTFCAPFAVEIPDGVSAYTCESAPGGVLELTSQSSPIPANTPVILNAEGGLTSTTFYGVKVPNESDDLITGGLLRGNVSTAAMDVPSDGSAYLLQRNNSKTGFYQVTGTGFKIGYNRCYMVQPTTSAREAFFFEDDNPTAINAIEAAEAKAKGLKDGKYLINGRIVMVNNGRAFGANGQILK